MNIYEVVGGNIDRLKKGLSMLHNEAQLRIIYSTLTDSAPIKDMSFKERKARALAIEQLLNLPHKELEIIPEMKIEQVKRTYKKR